MIYRRFGPKLTYQAIGASELVLPAMEKSPRNPILSNPSGIGDGKIWWPCVRDVMADGIIANPLGRYYLWAGDDHGDGGIFVAFANHPLGPWMWANSGNAVIDNDTPAAGLAGTNRDTPWVVPSNDGSTYHLYIHSVGAGNAQSTQLLTGTDGLTWTPWDGNGQGDGVVVDVDPEEMGTQVAHTGYFKPIKIGNLWLGNHRVCGTSPGFMEAISYSMDGEYWTTDYRAMYRYASYQADAADTDPIVMGLPALFSLLGQWWGVFTYRPDQDSEVDYLKIAPLGQDLLSPLGELQDWIPLGGTGDFDETTLRGHGSLLIEPPYLYQYYTGRNSSGTQAIGVAIGDWRDI